MITSSYIVVSIIVLVLSFLYYDRKRRQSRLRKNNIPGPEPRFFGGNFFEIKNKGNVPTITDWYKTYGRVFGYYIGSEPRVVVSDLNLLRKILVKDFHLFNSRSGFVRGGLQADESHEVSLISIPLGHKRWKEQRSMLTTAFTSMKMKQTIPLISDSIDATIERIDKSASNKAELDLYAVFQGLTLDTIGRAAFGVETNVQRDPENDTFLKAAKRVFEPHLNGSLVYLPLFFNFLFPEYDWFLFRIRQVQWFILKKIVGYEDHVSFLHAMVAKVISERRSMSSEKSEQRKDLLQTMLDANVAKDEAISLNSLTASSEELPDARTNGDQAIENGGNKKVGAGQRHYMTDEEIAANSFLFFEAGYETTSTLLGYVTYVMIKYREIQDKVREEINQLYARDGEFNYNVITSLPYLDAVLNETMRMYPPVTFFVSRTASVDYTYTMQESDGKERTFTIPKGAGVQVPVYNLHHDEEYWTSPEVFNPDRFLPGNAAHDQMAFQPFGSGPRNCIGMRFALLEAKMAIARVLHQFKLEPGSGFDATKDVEVDYKPVTMTPKNGIKVKLVAL